MPLFPYGAAAAIHPLPGLYEGEATVESTQEVCQGIATVGETIPIKLQYTGPDAGTFKYWVTLSTNPPEIEKFFLQVNATRGTDSPTGDYTVTEFSGRADSRTSAASGPAISDILISTVSRWF